MSNGHRGTCVKAFARVGGAWLASVVLGACSNDLSALYRKPNNSGDATSACGLSYGASECAACASTNCCRESTSCASNAACATYEACLGKCDGDPQCRSQCTADNRIGVGSSADEVSALGACLVEHCGTACGLSCGSIGAYVSPPATARECQDCVAANSCDNARACGLSPDCDAYLRCILACSTYDCRETCATNHATGAKTYAAFANDYGGQCAESCSHGGNWNCVGHVVWPAPRSTTTTVTFEGVHDPNTAARIADAGVSFCLPLDTDCRSPFMQAFTDATGRVSLQIPTAQDNEANQAFIGFFRITKSGYLPTYMYYSFPFTEETVSFRPAFSPWLSPVATIPTVPGYAWVSGGVIDCLDSAAWGVQVVTDDPTLGPATYNTALSIMGMPGEQATDQSGLAIFPAVPVGPLVVTATPVGLEEPSSTLHVDVRDGAVTGIALWPTPSTRDHQ